MKTLAQFKQELNVDNIQLLQGKGRKFATVRDISIIVSKECDLSKPLFVTKLNDQETGQIVANAYVIVNSEAKLVEML